jgi:hypothetical protein
MPSTVERPMFESWARRLTPRGMKFLLLEVMIAEYPDLEQDLPEERSDDQGRLNYGMVQLAERLL